MSDSVRIPFGKHYGKPLDEIPPGYLSWCLRQIGGDLEPWLRDAIVDELRRRAGGGKQRRTSARASGADQRKGDAGSGGTVAVLPIVDRWFREMTLRFHPDRGGSHDAYVAVSAANDRLRQMLKECVTP